MTNVFSSLNTTNSTIFEWHGKELRTMQDPYVGRFDSNVGEIDLYKAAAVDAQGNEYEVYWDIINHDTTDESEACNWDKPLSVVRMARMPEAENTMNLIVYMVREGYEIKTWLKDVPRGISDDDIKEMAIDEFKRVGVGVGPNETFDWEEF